MRRVIPENEAFAYYLSLGPQRSYEKVAKQFDVSVRGITKCASKHKWSARLAEIDQAAREKTERAFIESKAETRERHLKMLRAVETQGLIALQKFPIDNGFAGVKAIEAAIKLQRVILGEPSAHVGVSIQETTRREVESFLARIDEPEEDEGDDEDGLQPDPTPEG